MVNEMKKGKDIVIGSRFVNEKKPFSLRMIGSHLIASTIRLTTGFKIKDPTSGMRIFNRETIKEFAEKLNYGPEPDTIAYLLRCKANIREYQVSMNERIAGESYLNVTKSIQYMFHMVLSILIVQWFRGKTNH